MVRVGQLPLPRGKAGASLNALMELRTQRRRSARGTFYLYDPCIKKIPRNTPFKISSPREAPMVDLPASYGPHMRPREYRKGGGTGFFSGASVLRRLSHGGGNQGIEFCWLPLAAGGGIPGTPIPG